MSRAKKMRYATALAIAGAAALLMGCGSAPGIPGIAAPGLGGVVGPAGVGGVPGGCMPVTTPIGFTGTNVYVDGSSIIAGYNPTSGMAYGQVYVGGGAATGQYVGNSAAGDGQIMLSIMNYMNGGIMPYGTTGAYPGAYPGMTGAYPGAYPYGTTGAYPGMTGGYGTGGAQISGMLTIGPSAMQDMYGMMGMMGYSPYGYTNGMTPYAPMPGSPYGPYPGSAYPGTYPGMTGYGGYSNMNICASSLALNLGYMYTSGGGYGSLFGVVYVYLNGTNHGIKLQF